ncbi:hypothetical protein ACWT_0547 [Actinoplanes sp. SE50]|uniref:hypothetical protein n=1 Tax=unclassified Actinoplanes TaxID=2626549 RepID=UPI00023ECDCD|nr:MULTISPECIES: hypothetical protein [unclassified Actinoplanes]AEV81560.1 hypothetical protein ACPL_663 [Actinoplanes sp. SE50/110]ATO79962.1 hypothetical protein ACWT_0547 [Actinoplanes sp. SE50]SLL97364.1 hypothetical protein ACSP50_0566 [Actinoplanes sp. SE50/110]
MPNDTEEQLSTALHDIVKDRPYTPDFDRIESRGRTLKNRRLAWRAGGGATFAVAAVTAIAVAVGGTGTQAPARTEAQPGPTRSATATSPATSATQQPLVQLAAYLTTIEKQPGDAALVRRDEWNAYNSPHKDVVWDLYADNGKYYFAKTRAGLPAKVRHNQTDAGDTFRVAVEAAKYAVNGDLTVARKKMADMTGAFQVEDPGPGVVPPYQGPIGKKVPRQIRDVLKVNLVDNRVWLNSIFALEAGAGSPTVRAGVLRLLSTLPEVKVTQGILDGKATLTLTVGKPAMAGDRTEALTIDATTGVPMRFLSGAGASGANYQVTRVSLADVAAGRF